MIFQSPSTLSMLKRSVKRWPVQLSISRRTEANGAGDVDAGESDFEIGCGTVTVVPIVEPLDRAGEEVWADVAKDGCLVVK